MSPRGVDPERLAELRGSSQLLHRPADVGHPADVVREAGPVQAQEQRAARHAFRARGRALTAAAVDRARVEERSLLRAWLMRKTVHLIATEDAGWMLPLFAAPTAGWARRRMTVLGLDSSGQDRALELLHREVDAQGSLTRGELSDRLDAAGLDAAQEVKYHLWLVATLEGDLCLGPDRGGLPCVVRASEWIGTQRRRPREDSLAELARRYVRAYAPAGERDFARWAGLPLRDCRLGLERIASELAELRAGGEVLLVPARGRRRRPSAPVVRLLGAYDNYNLGYVSRGHAVGTEHERRIVPGGGIVRPTITVGGRCVGTWSSKRSGKRLAVMIEPFGDLDASVGDAIAAEVDDLGRFEDLTATL